MGVAMSKRRGATGYVEAPTGLVRLYIRCAVLETISLSSRLASVQARQERWRRPSDRGTRSNPPNSPS